MNFNVNERGMADGFCLVKSVDKRVSSKGGAYLDLTLSDNSGEINGKIWDYDEEAYGIYAVGDIVKVRGLVSKYNGADQIKIERIRKAVESDNINPADFVEQAAYDGEAMYNELVNIASSFNNKDLREITLKIYADHKDKLTYWPAAFRLHHAIRSGLMMHTLSIVRLCDSVCNMYPSVNRELLIAGAMLHDVGKVYEYDVTGLGTANGYTTEGNLVGHLVKGAILIEKAAEEIGADEKIKMMLQHMMISHHGEPDFGAAVRPSFIEAEILSSLDSLDAKIYEMAEAVISTDLNGFSNKLWALDNRKMYNHGLNDVKTDAKLF